MSDLPLPTTSSRSLFLSFPISMMMSSMEEEEVADKAASSDDDITWVLGDVGDTERGFILTNIDERVNDIKIR